MSVHSSTPHLIGRDAECCRIADLLASARGRRSGVIVLCGEPGIGKSALCEWARANTDGMRVLSARGVESEVDLAFAGLSELCAEDLDRVALLPEPQARALEGALARRDAAVGDRFAIGAAVLSLLGIASDEEPLLVIVDDAQWFDAASADALLFAARRLRGENVAMLVATRPGTDVASDGYGLPRVTITGLDPRASRELLAAAHGDMPEDVAQVLTDHSAGHPLALLEVPRLLTRAQLAGRQPIERPLLPVGPTLRRALTRRLSGLPSQARDALLVAAASGVENVQPLVDALAVAGVDRALLDVVERSGVLTITGERFEFRHPLLRAAIYDDAGGPARRAAHRALARVTSDESQAWHLAHATVGEDEAVAAAMEQVGMEARRRGAPAAAAAALDRAAHLSPRGGAPRVRRLTEAAHDAYVAGRPGAALGLVDEVLVTTPRDTASHADAQHLRGRILVLQGHEDTAFRVLVEEARRDRYVNPSRAAAMLAEASLNCLSGADIRTATITAREACAIAPSADPSAQVLAMSMLASALALGGGRAEATALLDRCLPLLRAADPLSEASGVLAHAAHTLAWIERNDTAFELFDRLVAAGRAASAPATLPYALAGRAELHIRTGRWAPALAEAEEAMQLSEQVSQNAVTAIALDCLAYLAAATGHERRCRDLAARSLALVQEHHLVAGRTHLAATLGFLELCLGRPARAIPHLQSARDLAEQHGLAEPNVIHWQADLIEAYILAGDLAEADAALEAFEQRARQTGGHWALGTAGRCRGLRAGEHEADACFGTALEHLETLSAPFELARTHLCQGQRLRRAGRRIDARVPLRVAIEGFDRLSARPWTARARAELRATGVTVRSRRDPSNRDELTAHELQVALIVADGASNRDAAAALFLSPKTIEFHLAHIYNKLGVRTRTELAAVAAAVGGSISRSPAST